MRDKQGKKAVGRLPPADAEEVRDGFEYNMVLNGVLHLIAERYLLHKEVSLYPKRFSTD